MIGVVADDTTGSLDIGVMFHRAGCSVQMFTALADGSWPAANVTIVDTDSRLDPAGHAYEKVLVATRRLMVAGSTRFYKKTCSVFRGNVGAEFEALLEGTGEKNLIIAGAYPLLGRSTRDGQHFVHGRPLEKTEFARDPIHPRATSDLRAILAEQTDRPIGVVPLSVVRNGREALRAALEAMARAHTYLIVDGETQDDLTRLAEASTGFRAFGGSAGFASEWPRALALHSFEENRRQALPSSEAGLLFVAGSLTPQTKAQTQRLLATQLAGIEFAPLAFGLDDAAAQRWISVESIRIAALLAAGKSVLVFTTQEPEHIQASQNAARAAGLEIAVYGRKISGWLADLCSETLARTWPAGLVVAGGDTSGSISRRLGISGCQLVGELEPGIPLCLALGLARPLPVVFKSGSFGSEEFLVQTGERIAGFTHLTHPSPC